MILNNTRRMKCKSGNPLTTMDNIMVWNVRGLNKVQKQIEVRKFISTHNIENLFLLIISSYYVSRN